MVAQAGTRSCGEHYGVDSREAQGKGNQAGTGVLRFGWIQHSLGSPSSRHPLQNPGCALPKELHTKPLEQMAYAALLLLTPCAGAASLSFHRQLGQSVGVRCRGQGRFEVRTFGFTTARHAQAKKLGVRRWLNAYT